MSEEKIEPQQENVAETAANEPAKEAPKTFKNLFGRTIRPDSGAPSEANKKLEEELQEYKDKYLRTLAEMENSRKRMQKDKQDSTRFAIENVLAEMLTPLDNLENALAFAGQMSEETRNWAMGFQMIAGQFKEVLSNSGVHPFTSVGTPFDPHRHQAVEIEETDEKPDGTIVQEFVKGYMCGERTIRPARVKVAKKPGQKELNNNEEK